jgi:RNA polymerase sigma-70 factor (family 1)
MLADNDQLLFQQMKNDGEEGFSALFQKYSKPLKTEAYYRLKDLQLAEDVVQEFFLTLWEKRDSIHIDRSVKYFFYQSVRNRCYDMLDKREVYIRKTREYADGEEEHTLPPLPELMHAATGNVNYYMNALPPQASRVFQMIVIENKKKREVAAQMAVSINTVKSQLTRAISILRKRFVNSV